MKKIALVMGGGVSLGTYIAGVLTELLYTLEHNESGEEVVIDVIAGASAGSMTAAMAAKALLYDKELVPKLREAWVERIAWRKSDGRPGLKREFPDNPAVPVLALLNDEVVGKIAEEMLTPPTADQHGGGVSGDSLGRVDVAFTLANLHGVPYEVPYRNATGTGDEGLISTIFSDWAEFHLGPDAADKKENDDELKRVWEDVRSAAVASGAFPFAFKPKKVEREIEDFGSQWLRKWVGDEDTKAFYYSDGGTFNNEPLRLAAKLARERDTEEPGGERLFLFVDPYLTEIPYKDEFSEEELSLLAYAKRLVEMFLSESTAKDFLRAHRYDTRLKWFESLLERFATLVDGLDENQRQLGATALGEEVDGYLREKLGIDSEKEPSGEAVEEDKHENLRRIERTYWGPLQAGEWDSSKQCLMGNLILSLELASGLRGKRPMNLYLLAPTGSKPLAGDFLMNFGGFFSERLRVADFNHGRVDCKKFLEESGGAFGLKWVRDPGFDYEYDESLKDTTYADLNYEEKSSFKEWFYDAFDWAYGRAIRNFGYIAKIVARLARGAVRKLAFSMLVQPKAP